jgi:hypothetical protein
MQTISPWRAARETSSASGRPHRLVSRQTTFARPPQTARHPIRRRHTGFRPTDACNLLRGPFATAENAPFGALFSTRAPSPCKGITNPLHQPGAHRLVHTSVNRKFPCCSATGLLRGALLANVFLPQRSQGSGGVREAFLRRSAGQNGTCTRTEPSGPQDRMRTQAEPPGLRGGCS